MPIVEAGNKSTAAPTAISQPRRWTAGTAAIFLFIMLCGLAVWFPMLILPMWRMVRARNWPTVPCIIITSQMTSQHDRQGTYHRVKIVYRYSFHGRVYIAQRYSVDDSASTNGRLIAVLVAHYRPGSRAKCFVNPADPAEALLNRGWGWLSTTEVGSLVFVLIVSGFIALLGGGGLIFIIGSWHRGGAVPSSDIRPVMPPALSNHRATEPAILRAKDGPVGRFMLALFIALGVNTIVPSALVAIWKQPSPGRVAVWVTVFAIPFLAIGVASIVWAFFRFLALSNPRPELIIENRIISLGRSAEVKWSFRGRCDRIARLKISLEGREEASHQSGSYTVTDRHTFHRAMIADVTRRIDVAAGKSTLMIPAGSMHSFSGQNNAIVWSLKVYGEIDGWPDVREEFPIEVTVA